MVARMEVGGLQMATFRPRDRAGTPTASHMPGIRRTRSI